MHVTVGRVPLSDLSVSREEECSAMMRNRVSIAREQQQKRYSGMNGITCNAHAAGRWIDAHGLVTPQARTMLQRAAEGLMLSARGYHRVLKIARTIADLDQANSVCVAHVGEALRYRHISPSQQ